MWLIWFSWPSYSILWSNHDHGIRNSIYQFNVYHIGSNIDVSYFSQKRKPNHHYFLCYFYSGLRPFKYAMATVL